VTIDGERWVPGIGDPTMIGWVTVAAYFICALLCFAAARKRQYVVIKRQDVDSNPRLFWLLLALLLIALGFNKQLDLQSLFTQIGRDIAMQQGWYEDRAVVQTLFIVALGLLGMMFLVLTIVLLRHCNSKVKLALIGCVFLFLFILTRATSFHKVDQLLGVSFAETKVNWILELGGTGIIVVAALAVLIDRSKSEF